MQHLKIGTRKSQLALWQTHHVQGMLQNSGFSIEIVPIETIGDKILDVEISKIGSKGVFTEEIEESLKAGKIDLAVHSAKDMPSELPTGFQLVAFAKREKPNDVLVGRSKEMSLDQPDLVIGTSSTRRIAFLRHYYPRTRQMAIRGNLQTRIGKMESGKCDALLLAYAGAHRMGYDHLIVRELPITKFVPPAGQGSITLEAFETLDPTIRKAVRELVNHQETELCIRAERSFLKTMQGGCSIPVFSHAHLERHRVQLTGGIISLDGAQLISETAESAEEPEELGRLVAHRVLERGGTDILLDIKNQLGH